mgnify:CR=1 FL=1
MPSWVVTVKASMASEDSVNPGLPLSSLAARFFHSAKEVSSFDDEYARTHDTE